MLKIDMVLLIEVIKDAGILDSHGSIWVLDLLGEGPILSMHTLLAEFRILLPKELGDCILLFVVLLAAMLDSEFQLHHLAESLEVIRLCYTRATVKWNRE